MIKELSEGTFQIMRLNTREQLRHHKEKRRISVDKGIVRRHFPDYEMLTQENKLGHAGRIKVHLK